MLANIYTGSLGSLIHHLVIVIGFFLLVLSYHKKTQQFRNSAEEDRKDLHASPKIERFQFHRRETNLRINEGEI